MYAGSKVAYSVLSSVHQMCNRRWPLTNKTCYALEYARLAKIIVLCSVSTLCALRFYNVIELEHLFATAFFHDEQHIQDVSREAN